MIFAGCGSADGDAVAALVLVLVRSVWEVSVSRTGNMEYIVDGSGGGGGNQGDGAGAFVALLPDEAVMYVVIPTLYVAGVATGAVDALAVAGGPALTDSFAMGVACACGGEGWVTGIGGGGGGG